MKYCTLRYDFRVEEQVGQHRICAPKSKNLTARLRPQPSARNKMVSIGARVRLVWGMWQGGHRCISILCIKTCNEELVKLIYDDRSQEVAVWGTGA